MERMQERRKEQRLDFNWPVWFAEGFGRPLSQGQMINISSGGTAFKCQIDKNCLHTGQKVTSRFSVPFFGADGLSTMASFTRTGRICRVNDIDKFGCCVAVEFSETLPFKPAEQGVDASDIWRKLKAITI